MIVPETISINVSRSQRAFTLVEMLAVIAVMLLMLKLTLPRWMDCLGLGKGDDSDRIYRKLKSGRLPLRQVCRFMLCSSRNTVV